MAKIRTTASRVHLLTSRCGAIPELRSRSKRATVLVCQRSSVYELCVSVCADDFVQTSAQIHGTMQRTNKQKQRKPKAMQRDSQHSLINRSIRGLGMYNTTLHINSMDHPTISPFNDLMIYV